VKAATTAVETTSTAVTSAAVAAPSALSGRRQYRQAANDQPANDKEPRYVSHKSVS
jgi:hypothetical protein